MLQQFGEHIQNHFPFLKNSKLYVAVSGGIDSMVLVDLLHKSGFNFHILHCNFQLRGKESDGDAHFVKAYADKNTIPVSIVRFDTKKYAEERKVSTQLAARELRYNWFYSELKEHQFDYIMTAHHADDSLETFIINLSRGTGLEGLLGIPAVNEAIVRPLLAFSREAIEAYAKEHKIKWREDSSNASDGYLRNQIRHHVVPSLKEMNPNFLEGFQKTIQHLQQSKSMVEDASGLVFAQVCKKIGDAYYFDIEQLQRLQNPNAYLFYWLQDFGFTAWHDIYNLADAQSGKQVFSASHTLLKDRHVLILSVREKSDTNHYHINAASDDVNFPLKFAFQRVSDISEANSNCIFVDEDTLQFPLTLRKWEEADYFYPIGMKGKKKLSKYFKDEKMSLLDKSAVWLLCSGNQIVWIINKRQDDRFKVTQNTTHILQITLDT